MSTPMAGKAYKVTHDDIGFDGRSRTRLDACETVGRDIVQIIIEDELDVALNKTLLGECTKS